MVLDRLVRKREPRNTKVCRALLFHFVSISSFMSMNCLCAS